MKLQATVIDIHSASQYADKTRRVTLKVTEADCMNTRLTVRSDDLREDDALTILVLRQDEAARLYREIDEMTAGRDVPYSVNVANLLDQLRPDAPPPFLTDNTITMTASQQPDTADTQEFRLGGTA